MYVPAVDGSAERPPPLGGCEANDTEKKEIAGK